MRISILWHAFWEVPPWVSDIKLWPPSSVFKWLAQPLLCFGQCLYSTFIIHTYTIRIPNPKYSDPRAYPPFVRAKCIKAPPPLESTGLIRKHPQAAFMHKTGLCSNLIFANHPFCALFPLECPTQGYPFLATWRGIWQKFLISSPFEI